MVLRFALLIIILNLSVIATQAQTSAVSSEQVSPFELLTMTDLKKMDTPRDLKQSRAATLSTRLSPNTVVVNQGTTQGWAQGETFKVFRGKHFIGYGVVLKAENDYCIFRLQAIAGLTESLLHRALLFRPVPITDASLELLLGKDSWPALIEEKSTRIRFGKGSVAPSFDRGSISVTKSDPTKKVGPRKSFIKLSLGLNFESSINDTQRNQQIRKISGNTKIENADKERFDMMASFTLTDDKKKRWNSADTPFTSEKTLSYLSSVSLDVKDIARTRFFYFTMMDFSRTEVNGVFRPRLKWQGTPAGLGYVLVEREFKQIGDNPSNLTVKPKFSPWIDYEATQMETSGIITESKTTTFRYSMALETKFNRGPFTISDTLSFKPAHNSTKQKIDWVNDAPLDNLFSFEIIQGNITFAYNHHYLWDRRNLERGYWVVQQEQSFTAKITFEI